MQTKSHKTQFLISWVFSNPQPKKANGYMEIYSTVKWYTILSTCQTKAINWYFIAYYTTDILRQNWSSKIFQKSGLHTIVFYEFSPHKAKNPGPFSLPKSPDVLQIWPVIHHLICSNRSASHTLKTSNWFMYSLSTPEDACLSSYSLFLSWPLYLAILISLLPPPPSFSVSLELSYFMFLLALVFRHEGRIYNEPSLGRRCG